MNSPRFKTLEDQQFDVLVVGAGINGATSAAALANHGYNVAIVDRGDYAAETSMHSSNLVWGGIKYLESHEYALVNNLCKGRNELMRRYPTAMREIRFLASIEPDFRFPAWFIYSGSWVYWLMGRGFTQKPQLFSAKRLLEREPVVRAGRFSAGVEYSDAYLFENDTRFAFSFVRNAQRAGAKALNYTALKSAQFVDGLWMAELEDQQSGERFSVQAKCLINAAGTGVDALNDVLSEKTKHHHLFSKGVHLIVKRLTEVERVVTFFADDGRLFFAIPMGDKTCIGTTDQKVSSPEVELTEEDVSFVLDNINKRLRPESAITRQDIIASRCGVRPLAMEADGGKGDFLQLSRKHAIELNHEQPMMSIFGGKLTDCVNVGDEVVDYVAKLIDQAPSAPTQCWYGEDDLAGRDRLREALKQVPNPSWSLESQVERLWRRYGNDALGIAERMCADAQAATLSVANISVAELEYLRDHEMVLELEDFLRRRTKIALTTPHHALMADPGMDIVCRVLFGEQASAKRQKYLDDHPSGYLPQWLDQQIQAANTAEENA